jgi:hypothetical protein
MKNHKPKSYSQLLKIAARVETDFDRALERGDNERGVRHANRIYMIDERLWIEASVGRISGYSDLSTDEKRAPTTLT